jgi:hypothetical protein
MKVSKFSSFAFTTYEGQVIYETKHRKKEPAGIENKLLGGTADPKEIEPLKGEFDQNNRALVNHIGYKCMKREMREEAGAIINRGRCSPPVSIYFEESAHLLQLRFYPLTKKEFTQISKLKDERFKLQQKISETNNSVTTPQNNDESKTKLKKPDKVNLQISDLGTFLDKLAEKHLMALDDLYMMGKVTAKGAVSPAAYRGLRTGSANHRIIE